LWIIGSGPEAAALARLAEQLGLSSKVKLLGQVSLVDIPAWLNQCTIGILPIRRDVFLDFAFPNKLPEFIITRKAVIVSRLKAIRHYFSEEALAYFEPNCPADLATQMVRLYRDSGLRDRLTCRAVQEYTAIRWNPMKQRYLALIEEMINPDGRKAEPTGPIQSTARVR
jgi:glycosyltransferase involved in cell wall biosynthesis